MIKPRDFCEVSQILKALESKIQQANKSRRLSYDKNRFTSAHNRLEVHG